MTSEKNNLIIFQMWYDGCFRDLECMNRCSNHFWKNCSIFFQKLYENPHKYCNNLLTSILKKTTWLFFRSDMTAVLEIWSVWLDAHVTSENILPFSFRSHMRTHTNIVTTFSYYFWKNNLINFQKWYDRLHRE